MSLILNGTTGISDVDGTAAAPALTGTDSNTGIFFPAADTIAFAEGGVEAVRIDSSGNVGIGTSSPTSKLEVSGGASAPVITLSTTGSIPGAAIKLLGAATGAARNWQIGASFTTINGSLEFTPSTANGGSTFTTPAVSIDSSGNLLVGTTSGAGRLTVQSDSSVVQPVLFNSTAAGTGATSLVRFRRNGNNVGEIEITGSSTSYVTSSDYRLKESVQPMTGALAKVAALKAVTYKWKVDGSDGQGFIAHELAEVCPSAVTGEKDAVETYTDEDGVEQTRIKPQGIDTSFLVATLSAAIQELHALVKTQDSTITALTTRITALEAI